MEKLELIALAKTRGLGRLQLRAFIRQLALVTGEKREDLWNAFNVCELELMRETQKDAFGPAQHVEAFLQAEGERELARLQEGVYTEYAYDAGLQLEDAQRNLEASQAVSCQLMEKLRDARAEQSEKRSLLEDARRQLVVARAVSKDVAIEGSAARQQLVEVRAENVRLTRQVDDVREDRDSAWALGIHIYAYDDAPECFQMHDDDSDWVVVVPPVAREAYWPAAIEDIVDSRSDDYHPSLGERIVVEMGDGTKVLIFCHA